VLLGRSLFYEIHVFGRSLFYEIHVFGRSLFYEIHVREGPGRGPGRSLSLRNPCPRGSKRADLGTLPDLIPTGKRFGLRRGEVTSLFFSLSKER
jgi:hypothetical protein